MIFSSLLSSLFAMIKQSKKISNQNVNPWLVYQTEGFSNEEWKKFGVDLKILVGEFEAFTQIVDELEKLELSLRVSIKKKDEWQSELEATSKSEKSIFGFFTRVSKEDTIASLVFNINQMESQIQAVKKMINLACEVILNVEIQLIKDRKNEKFNEMLTQFAQSRLDKLATESDFWRSVIPSQDDEVGRFTTLQMPRLQ
jgi:hypothetical protein